MRLIEKAYKIANKEIGIREVDGAGSNPRIIEYLKAVDFNDEITLTDSIPWCSAFINWCIQQAGGRGTRNAMARSFLAWGKETKDPKPGDLAIFKRGQKSYQGHVAMFVSQDSLWITVLGGNQSDAVCIQKYRKNSLIQFRTSKD